MNSRRFRSWEDRFREIKYSRENRLVWIQGDRKGLMSVKVGRGGGRVGNDEIEEGKTKLNISCAPIQMLYQYTFVSLHK